MNTYFSIRYAVVVSLLLATFSSITQAAGIQAYLFADEYVKAANEELLITVVFNQPVVVEGDVMFKFGFATTGEKRTAVYFPERSMVLEDGSSVISFSYQVKAGDMTEGLTLQSNPFDTSNGRFVHNKRRSRVVPVLGKERNSLPVTIDAVAPRITGVEAAPAGGQLEAGESIRYRVSFDEEVFVAGVPYLPVRVMSQQGEQQHKAVYEPGDSDAQNKTFRWQPSGGEGEKVVVDNRIVTGESSGLMYDPAGNQAESLSLGNVGTTEYQLAGQQSVVSEVPLPDFVEKIDTAEEEVSGEEGSRFSYGIGLGIQGLAAEDDQQAGLGYRVASRYQPMLEAFLGYNFLPWPQRLLLSATVTAYARNFNDRVDYEGSGDAELDSSEVANPEVFGGLNLQWKPSPTGFGLLAYVKQDQFIVLERTSTELATLIDTDTLVYGIGGDYHFDLADNRFGIFLTGGGQQANASSDDNVTSDNIDMGARVETGIEWLGEQTPGELSYAAQLYYIAATASMGAFDYTQQQAGLKFRLIF